MKREETLDEAKKCVCTDRNKQYGGPEDNFSAIGDLWTAYIKHKFPEQFAYTTSKPFYISPAVVADLMMLFKLGRNATADTPKADSYVDIAGYAACGCEVATEKQNTECLTESKSSYTSPEIYTTATN